MAHLPSTLNLDLNQLSMDDFSSFFGDILKENDGKSPISARISNSQNLLLVKAVGSLLGGVDQSSVLRGVKEDADGLDIDQLLASALKIAPNGPPSSPLASRSASPADSAIECLVTLGGLLSSLDDGSTAASETVPAGSAAPAASMSPPAGPAAPPTTPTPPMAPLSMAPPPRPQRKPALQIQSNAPPTPAPRPGTPITAAPPARKVDPVINSGPSSLPAAQPTAAKTRRSHKGKSLANFTFKMTCSVMANMAGIGWQLAYATPASSWAAAKNVFTRAPDDRCFKVGDLVRIDAPEDTIMTVLQKTCQFSAFAIRRVLQLANHMIVLEVVDVAGGLVSIRAPRTPRGEAENVMQLPASFFVLDCDAYGDKPTPTAQATSTGYLSSLASYTPLNRIAPTPTAQPTSADYASPIYDIAPTPTAHAASAGSVSSPPSPLDDIIIDPIPEYSYDVFAGASSFIYYVAPTANAAAAPTVDASAAHAITMMDVAPANDSCVSQPPAAALPSAPAGSINAPAAAAAVKPAGSGWQYIPPIPPTFMEKMTGFNLGDKKRDAPELDERGRTFKRHLRTASWEPPASSLMGFFSLGSNAPLKGRRGMRRLR